MSRSAAAGEEPGDRLRLLFACCHPRLKDDEQIALVLHAVCGLGARETAYCLLTSVAAVEKRLVRGKSLLASSNGVFYFESGEAVTRLAVVQRALHLLFNEAYHNARTDICSKTIALVQLLLGHRDAQIGSTYGLAALMCLHAARLPARTGASGQHVPLEMQDRSKWDPMLVAEGFAYLEQSARRWEPAEYQIEAAIAAVHASAPSAEETDWNAIIDLYDSLFVLRPSAIVALNRAIAVGRRTGPERGLEEVLSISGDEVLETYPFYWATLGEFALGSGKRNEAKRAFRKAREIARNPFERDHYAARIAACSAA